MRKRMNHASIELNLAPCRFEGRGEMGTWPYRKNRRD